MPVTKPDDEACPLCGEMVAAKRISGVFEFTCHGTHATGAPLTWTWEGNLGAEPTVPSWLQPPPLTAAQQAKADKKAAADAAKAADAAAAETASAPAVEPEAPAEAEAAPVAEESTAPAAVFAAAPAADEAAEPTAGTPADLDETGASSD